MVSKVVAVFLLCAAVALGESVPNLSDIGSPSETVINANQASTDGAYVLQTIKNHLPKIVKSKISSEMLTLVNEKEKTKTENGDFAKCKESYFPNTLKDKLLLCGEEQSAELQNYLTNALESLDDAGKLLTHARTRLDECAEQRAAYKERQKNVTTTTTTPKPGKARPGKASRVVHQLGNALTTMNEFFQKNGCYVLLTGELALDSSIIAFDFFTSTQLGLDRYNTAEKAIGACMTRKIDSWMLENCSAYAPNLGDKRRRRSLVESLL